MKVEIRGYRGNGKSEINRIINAIRPTPSCYQEKVSSMRKNMCAEESSEKIESTSTNPKVDFTWRVIGLAHTVDGIKDLESAIPLFDDFERGALSETLLMVIAKIHNILNALKENPAQSPRSLSDVANDIDKMKTRMEQDFTLKEANKHGK